MDAEVGSCFLGSSMQGRLPLREAYARGRHNHVRSMAR